MEPSSDCLHMKQISFLLEDRSPAGSSPILALPERWTGERDDCILRPGVPIRGGRVTKTNSSSEYHGLRSNTGLADPWEMKTDGKYNYSYVYRALAPRNGFLDRGSGLAFLGKIFW